MLYPFIFKPIVKERIWGGRQLENLYQKPLPPKVAIGESWEVSDRPGDASVIANGALAGKDLRWLMEHHAVELLGQTKSHNGRFPLLIKILDCQDTLSLQVHPPAAKAAQLGGEPKTEMWYVAQAKPGAKLFVGLRKGVSQAQFAAKVKDGTVAECFHQLPVAAGDAMFLPSGRVHALGAGLVIFEIQQNSDTTYRVFDWNRVGSDGKPRELHVPQSMESIDFADFEPSLCPRETAPADFGSRRALVADPLFNVELLQTRQATPVPVQPRRMQILGLVKGTASVSSPGCDLRLAPGQFCVVPACLDSVRVQAGAGTDLLRVTVGEA